MDTIIEKNKLAALKIQLEKEIKDLEEKVPDFGSDQDHMEEEMSEAEALSTNEGIAQTLRARLADVDTALENIHENKYGLCAECGSIVEDAILTIDPESRFCKACKLKQRA